MDDWLLNLGWIVLCLAVPIGWGIVVNAIFDMFSSKRGSSRDAAPPEYHI